MLQALVTFPGSMTLDSYISALAALQSLGCQVHKSPAVSKKAAGKAFNKALAAVVAPQLDPFTVMEELTADEERLIDAGLGFIHAKIQNKDTEGLTPLLDSLTVKATGKLKPNMSNEILAYYKENPGHTTAQCASSLAEKFVAHYTNFNDGFTRIRNLVNTICHAKGNQKRLQKRDGHVGKGGDAQVFLAE